MQSRLRLAKQLRMRPGRQHWHGRLWREHSKVILIIEPERDGRIEQVLTTCHPSRKNGEITVLKTLDSNFTTPTISGLSVSMVHRATKDEQRVFIIKSSLTAAPPDRKAPTYTQVFIDSNKNIQNVCAYHLQKYLHCGHSIYHFHFNNESDKLNQNR